MQEQIREAIVTFVKADYDLAYPSTPLVYPNAPFDWSNLPGLFAELEFEFYGGDQVGISLNPKRRVRGHVYVNVYQRAGTGTKSALQIVDWFSNKFKFAYAGIANFESPEPDGNDKVKGFHVERMKVCFFSDPA